MKIFGLCSTWREGELASGAIRSALQGCDRVLVMEAPVGDSPSAGIETDWSVFRREQRVSVRTHEDGYRSDAMKRTGMLGVARSWQTLAGEPDDCWILWVDADELLVNGQYLRDWLAIVPANAVNLPLRLVQFGGMVERCHAKLVRLAAVKEVVLSSYQLEVDWQGYRGTVALPNLPEYVPDFLAESWRQQQPGQPLPQFQEPGRRPPVGCEPYLFHRPELRTGNRTRLHEAEQDWLEQVSS